MNGQMKERVKKKNMYRPSSGESQTGEVNGHGQKIRKGYRDLIELQRANEKTTMT